MTNMAVVRLKKAYAVCTSRVWVHQKISTGSDFFTRLARQPPQYYWICVSDSRVLGNEIVGLEPGEVFVHLDIANVVVHSDLNCLSVLQTSSKSFALSKFGGRELRLRRRPCCHRG